MERLTSVQSLQTQTNGILSPLPSGSILMQLYGGIHCCITMPLYYWEGVIAYLIVGVNFETQSQTPRELPPQHDRLLFLN